MTRRRDNPFSHKNSAYEHPLRAPLRRVRGRFSLFALALLVLVLGVAYRQGTTLVTEGQLHSKHAFLAQDCAACHVQPLGSGAMAGTPGAHGAHGAEGMSANCMRCHLEMNLQPHGNLAAVTALRQRKEASGQAAQRSDQFEADQGLALHEFFEVFLANGEYHGGLAYDHIRRGFGQGIQDIHFPHGIAGVDSSDLDGIGMGTDVDFHAAVNDHRHTMMRLPLGDKIGPVGEGFEAPSRRQQMEGTVAGHNPGYFFEMMYQSGLYWQFLGWAQLLAGLLLLTQRYALLGALVYLSIIANIFVITISYDFAGTSVITGLMLLAGLLLLAWDWNRLRVVINLPAVPEATSALY